MQPKNQAAGPGTARHIHQGEALATITVHPRRGAWANHRGLRHSGSALRQKGNALVMALLALILSAVTATALFQQKERDRKAGTGHAEGTVLDHLRTAAQTAMLDFMLDIQAGHALSKPSATQPGAIVTITPTGTAPDLTWRPTQRQLADMGYLPAAWTDTTSLINNAPYDISWRRTPGCATTDCDIEGAVVLMGAVRDPTDPPGTSDAWTLGPILTHFGVEAGVSLPGSPAVVTGFGSTWTLPNPVPGAPPGVVAVRFGTASSLMSRFVRVGDTRDPSLAGKLTVQGATRLNGGAGVQGELQVLDADGNPCIRMQQNGDLTLGCSGRLNALQATFTGGAGGTGPGAGTTTVGPTEVKTTGRISGDSLVAEDSLAGQRLVLPDVTEGAACGGGTGLLPGGAGSQYAGLAGGGLAYCAAGRWRPVGRFRPAGTPCPATESGATATDPTDGQGLICRNGSYLRTAALLSNFVLVQTLQIPITTGPEVVTKPVCPAAGGGAGAEPLIILTANSEDAPIEMTNVGSDTVSTTLSGIKRFAEDNGTTWTVHLQRSSDDVVLQGLLIASVYCWYH